MKKIILMGICLLMGHVLAYTQRSLYTEDAVESLGTLSQQEAKRIDGFKTDPLVADVQVIKVNFEALQASTVTLGYNGTSTVAREFLRELHDDSPDGFSWFGTLTDETGVFFTVMGRQLASKFYMGRVPMLIVPLRDDYHLLVAYDHKIDDGICGQVGGKKGDGHNETDAPKGIPSPERIALADDACLMRVLWIVTAQAEPEIPMALELAARMLQDETNLAYFNSQITYRMEVARVERTSYVETISNVNATAYSVTSSYPSDLINLSTGAGLLSNVPTLRNLYQADVVVMVRTAATSNAQGFYGIAYGVPVGADVLNAGNAFALTSTQYMIGGRFTFAHEMGHIQGARHDNHAATPIYARGYIFSTSASDNRTIMAVGGSCNPPTGCRVQFFSNPNVTYLGIPVGVANANDNARRINETASAVLNFRATSTTLLLPAETFANEILARHLATQTISTNNSAVVAQSGSRVSMRAGNSVTLLPGFAANAGTVFTAYIGNCSTQSPVRVAAPTVVADEVATKIGVVLSPNPTTGRVKIALQVDASQAFDAANARQTRVEVYDMVGRQVLDTRFASTAHELDLSGQGDGTYFMVVTTPDGARTTMKVIKE